MYCIEKTVNGNKIVISKEAAHQSDLKIYVTINDTFMFLFDSHYGKYFAPLSHFIEEGWTKVDSKNKIYFNQKGNFEGYVRLFEYMYFDCYGKDINGYIVKEGKVFLKSSSQIITMIEKSISEIKTFV